jgi:hypothetical protein
MTAVIPIVVWHCLQEATLETLEAERSRSGSPAATLSSSDQRSIASLTTVAYAVVLLGFGAVVWGYFIQHSVTVAAVAFLAAGCCCLVIKNVQRHIRIKRLRGGR